MIGPSSDHLALLLHGDPAFASGAASFSSGLETMVADGWVTSKDELVAMMVGAIRCRWNTFDRVFLGRASRAGDQDELAEVDRELEVSMLGASARSASRRAGVALLGAWTRLGREEVARYRERVLAVGEGGHLSVAQGFVYSANGLDLRAAESLSCWAVLAGYASGAVRLGVVGHRSAQLALLEASGVIGELLASPVDPAATPCAWTPLLDIAIERHANAELRLFAS
jgi:urease accessory protein